MAIVETSVERLTVDIRGGLSGDESYMRRNKDREEIRIAVSFDS